MRNRPFGDRPDRHCARCSSARARILFHSARRGVSVRVSLSWFSVGRSPCFRTWQIHLGAMSRRQPFYGKRTARCSTTSRSVNALCLFVLFLSFKTFFFYAKFYFIVIFHTNVLRPWGRGNRGWNVHRVDRSLPPLYFSRTSCDLRTVRGHRNLTRGKTGRLLCSQGISRGGW